MASSLASKNLPRQALRVGAWSPGNSKVMLDWVRKFVAKVDNRCDPIEWPQSVQDLSDLIEGNPDLRMLATAMFDEVPDTPPYDEDPLGNKQIQDYKQMLDCFANIIMDFAPEWNKDYYDAGLIGFPFNAILDWPMATQSGYAFFLRPDVNEKFKAVLNAWRDEMLVTTNSQGVISTAENGWLCEEAVGVVETSTNLPDREHGTFQELFECDPEDRDHWGFTSWDSYFAKKFRAEKFDYYRPIDDKADPRVIVNSCESKAFSLQCEVNEYDKFWVKGQPYSVVEMLNHHPRASEFIGGTVYQAFLSPVTYHRWNSPVKGNVVHASIIPGTYFSEPVITGFNNPDDPCASPNPDPAAPNLAQGYIAHVATRTLFLIEADPPVGLVAVLHVGMADVSTCEILEKFTEGLPQPVEKGEEIGSFHHGGSTYCLVLKPGLTIEWVDDAKNYDNEHNMPIRGKLATVTGTTSQAAARKDYVMV